MFHGAQGYKLERCL